MGNAFDAVLDAVATSRGAPRDALLNASDSTIRFDSQPYLTLLLRSSALGLTYPSAAFLLSGALSCGPRRLEKRSVRVF